MIELTINDLFQRYKIDDGDANIYIVRDNTTVYYVGQSTGKTGVIGRLDAHFWRQRRAAGNYLSVFIGSKTASKAAVILKNHLKDSQRHDERLTKLHVRMTGIDLLTKLAQNNRLKWGTTDTLGRYVLENLPESSRWQIQLLTVDECRPAISRYVEATRIPTGLNVDTAERVLIYELHPLLNVMHN